MKTIFFSAIMLCYATLSFSQPLTVTVEGVGFVAGGDTATARDRAIADAQIRAVEQAFGVDVDARTALHKSLLISDTVTTQTQGMVSNYRITHEQIEPGGLYRVRLEAAVDPKTMQARLAAAAGTKRVLLVFPAGQSEYSETLNPLHRQLAQMFATAGFQLARLAMNPTMFMILDESAIIKLVGETDSDILVAGTLDAAPPHCPVSNYCAALATGHVRLYDGKNGSLIAVAETGKEPPRGFGHDTATARSDAMGNGADLLIQNLTDTLFHPPERQLTVAVIDIPDLEGYRRLKMQIEALRWVKQVKADSVGYHPVKSVFHVRFAQRPALFAGMLDKLGAYRLIGNSRLAFTLTAR